MKHAKLIWLAAALLLPLAAQAQLSPKIPPQSPPARQDHSQTPPDATTNGTLSRSNGTLTPPNVDPGMPTKPPPTGGNMPVISPPSSKDGVQPK